MHTRQGLAVFAAGVLIYVVGSVQLARSYVTRPVTLFVAVPLAPVAGMLVLEILAFIVALLVAALENGDLDFGLDFSGVRRRPNGHVAVTTTKRDGYASPLIRPTSAMPSLANFLTITLRIKQKRKLLCNRQHAGRVFICNLVRRGWRWSGLDPRHDRGSRRGRQRYSTEVQQLTRTRGDLRGRRRTVTCTDGRGWTCCRQMACKRSAVRARLAPQVRSEIRTNRTASTAGKYSNGGRLDRRTCVRIGDLPRLGLLAGTGFQALHRRWPACHLGKSPPRRPGDSCRLLITRPAWMAVSARDCCRICK